VGKDGFEPPKA